MGVLTNFVVPFLIAMGVLVVIHELGHYLAARWCGVKVLKFSVGFGRTLLSRRFGRDQTEWALSLFPLGGYVKMLDEREAPVPSADVPRAFNRQSVGKRIIIVLAGPLANLLLAVVLYAALYMHGLPIIKAILSEPPAQSAAAKAGLRAGDSITRIGETEIRSWQDVTLAVLDYGTDGGWVEVETRGATGQTTRHELDLSELRTDNEKGLLESLGLTLHDTTPVVGEMLKGGVAETAGVRVGDQILAVNGAPVDSWYAFVRQVQAHPGKSLSLDVLRDGRALTLGMVPDMHYPNRFEIFGYKFEWGKPIGRVGVVHRVDRAAFELRAGEIKYGPGAALLEGARQTWSLSIFSLRMLGKMVTGQLSWRNLSGPITIADYAGKSAQLGWIPFVSFLTVVSISLGVLNLLPIPVLDGGHLMYYIVEIVKGRPVSDRFMELGQQVGMAILLGLMLFAFYNDINRLLSS